MTTKLKGTLKELRKVLADENQREIQKMKNAPLNVHVNTPPAPATVALASNALEQLRSQKAKAPMLEQFTKDPESVERQDVLEEIARFLSELN